MANEIADACLAGTLVLLVLLAVTDMKTRLLPNEMVAGFALLGIIFHFTAKTPLAGLADMAGGAAAGFLTLYVIRCIANKYYGEDALGLGDVKLMTAGGLWLGTQGIMLALALGAFAALVQGLVYGLGIALRARRKPDFARLKIPAGPGFVVGLVAAFAVRIYTLHFTGGALAAAPW